MDPIEEVIDWPVNPITSAAVKLPTLNEISWPVSPITSAGDIDPTEKDELIPVSPIAWSATVTDPILKEELTPVNSITLLIEDPHDSSPQPFLPQPTNVPTLDKLPNAEVITPAEETPITSAGIISPTEEVKDWPVNSTVSIGVAVTVPIEKVADTPEGSIEYWTPQPDFPQACLPQPSTF